MNVCVKCGEPNLCFTLRRCKHIVCQECMVTCLKDFTKAKIPCPVEGCTKYVEDSVIRECLSNNQLKSYELLSHSPKVFKCLIKDCSNFIAYEEKNFQFNCTQCNQPNCLLCSTMHYPTEKCHTTNQEKFVEAASQYINKMKRNYIESCEKEDLIPNADSFSCPICVGFILPRKGVTLRSCLHNFCRPCLEQTYSASQFVNQLICSQCSTPLLERERRNLIGNEKLTFMSINAIKPCYFNCKEPNCDAVWDIGDYKGTYRCLKCKKLNCIACEFVHEGESCQEFRNTHKYKSMQSFQRNLILTEKVSCIKCRRLLIKKGGCGALKCNTCNINVCAYTGKLVGPEGCNCTAIKPCHKDCRFGCFPE